MQALRKQVESHLQSAVGLHLDLACVKLNKTEKKLNDADARLKTTEAKLDATEVKLNSTVAKLNDTEVKSNDTQNKLEKTTKLVEELGTSMFIWKIDYFSNILWRAKTREEEIIYSASFYTDRTDSYGYKLKVKCYPNCHWMGRNNCLLVCIVIMKGEYDAMLPWPFKKKVTLTLIDQQEDPLKRENKTHQLTAECSARPTQDEYIIARCPQFISHRNLYSRCYLVADTLFLQVEVGP